MRVSRVLPRSTRTVLPSGRGKKPSGVRYSSGLLTVSSACPHRRRVSTQSLRHRSHPRDHAPVLQFPNAPGLEPRPSSKAAVAVSERNLRHLLRCHRTDRRRPQRNHGGESRKGRPKALHCVRRVRHRVAARPVLPVLFSFVPGLGPELVLLGPHSLQVHRLDIFRVYAADRLDLMDDLIRHPAPGPVTQPVPDPPAGHSHEHRERHEQISGHLSSRLLNQESCGWPVGPACNMSRSTQEGIPPPLRKADYRRTGARA